MPFSAGELSIIQIFSSHAAQRPPKVSKVRVNKGVIAETTREGLVVITLQTPEARRWLKHWGWWCQQHAADPRRVSYDDETGVLKFKPKAQ